MWAIVIGAVLTMAIVVLATLEKEKSGRWAYALATAIFLSMTCIIAYDQGTGEIPRAQYSKVLKIGDVYKTKSIAEALVDRGNHRFVTGYITVLETENGDHIVRLLVSEPPKHFVVSKNRTYVPIQP